MFQRRLIWHCCGARSKNVGPSHFSLYRYLIKHLIYFMLNKLNIFRFNKYDVLMIKNGIIYNDLNLYYMCDLNIMMLLLRIKYE